MDTDELIRELGSYYRQQPYSDEQLASMLNVFTITHVQGNVSTCADCKFARHCYAVYAKQNWDNYCTVKGVVVR